MNFSSTGEILSYLCRNDSFKGNLEGQVTGFRFPVQDNPLFVHGHLAQTMLILIPMTLAPAPRFVPIMLITDLIELVNIINEKWIFVKKYF